MKIGIIGSGTWGCSLAQVCVDNGHKVKLYTNDQAQCDDINQNHKNSKFFYNHVFPKKLTCTTDLSQIVNKCSVIVLSVPTHAMRSVLEEIRSILKVKTTFINTAKGFDMQSGKMMSELVVEMIPKELLSAPCSLLGPSHAEEVVERKVTCINAISPKRVVASRVQKIFSNEYFRVYTSKDLVGAEMSSCIKNPIAIACGVAVGLGFGDNAKAAIITRGLNEMMKLGKLYGAEVATFCGLAGLGDLVVTCTSLHSRNFTAGYEIGKMNSYKKFSEYNQKTVEGINAVKVIKEIADKNGLILPIIDGLHAIIYENVSPTEVGSSLMNRPLRDETWIAKKQKSKKDPMPSQK